MNNIVLVSGVGQSGSVLYVCVCVCVYIYSFQILFQYTFHFNVYIFHPLILYIVYIMFFSIITRYWL